MILIVIVLRFNYNLKHHIKLDPQNFVKSIVINIIIYRHYL